jgi:3-hydroxyacyl-CoA dehydrogenase
MTAIEIMGHAQTDPSLIPLLMEQCRLHHFEPFHVRQNSTGYIYNRYAIPNQCLQECSDLPRIWAAIKREALLVVAEGVATPPEVDAIFKSVLKTPKGPCEQMDVVGLDVVLDIEEHYAHERQGLPGAPREFLRSMTEKGLLGVKSGRGFYKYGPNGAKCEE